MSSADFWDDQESAQATVAELKTMKAAVEPVQASIATLGELQAGLELAEELGEEEIAEELEALSATAAAALDKLEFQVMLGGEHDPRNAFLSIQAGAGGVDAADFAEMLLRMYIRWAERQEFSIEEADHQAADEAGIRSATVLIKGPFAYGRLKAEIGVHRLVRISPFDAQSRRHTAFAAVEAVPEFDAEAGIDIDEGDLRVDTYRAGGAGGQHVNKTESAIRITHLPTGIVVQCQSQRSQHKNRATAMQMLKARLFQLREREREDSLKQMYSAKGEIAWGSQIRSYVLHPYQMVKDHRTNTETGNTQAVFDGDLDKFMEEYLRSKSHK